MASNITISNGMAWSNDNSLMFYTDTLTRRVDVFDYDVDAGTISKNFKYFINSNALRLILILDIANRRPVYNYFTGGDLGSPDGMTIDANGNLFVASYGAGQVIQIDSSTGRKVRSIPIPTTNVTCPTFGGPNLDILFVTTAKSGLPDNILRTQPTAGALFQVTNLGVRGQSAGIPYKA